MIDCSKFTIRYNHCMREITAKDEQEIRENFPIDSCLRPPDLSVSTEAARAFDQLFDAARAKGPAADIAYNLQYPKYLFLEHLTSTRGLMLHGSNTPGLDVLRPIRASSDSSEFGNQPAIYASQDPLWAMYFAVLDRTGWSGTSNASIILEDDAGSRIRRYYFTLEHNHLRRSPWRTGAMYILPGEGFEPDPTMVGAKAGTYKVVPTHWIYRGELTPLAWLDLEPEDFPFRDCVWGYDSQAFSQRMDAESLAGYPFLEDPEIYPIIPKR